MCSHQRIVAFDIGIKNLAWCCADVSGGNIIVRGWANENILTGGTAEEDIAAAKCSFCSHKVSYKNAAGQTFCSRHCPPLTPALRDSKGKLLKKLPKATELKEIAKKADASIEKQHLKTGEAAKLWLSTRFCFPIEAAQNVKKVEMEVFHDGIQNVVNTNADLFSTCSEILLENQPVFKNPMMKSIQMMLFATLRDLVDGPPKLRLVHAGRKTDGATKGDEGYAERKGLSEAKVLEGLKYGKILVPGKPIGWFGEQAKKSDLADCLLMCADALQIQLKGPVVLKKDDSAFTNIEPKKKTTKFEKDDPAFF
jgi:hypothetical protein